MNNNANDALPVKRTPAQTVATIRDKLTKAQRLTLALQSTPATLAQPVPRDIDTLLRLLPDGAIPHDGDTEGARYDTREWLTPPSWSVTQSPQGGKGELRLSPPPDGLTAVERCLWPSLGLACARGACFLLEWVKSRRYMLSLERYGVQAHEVGQFRTASPVFNALFDAAEISVRQSRLVRTEDTIHALANGDVRKIKTTEAPDGSITTVDEGAIYDVKAASLELAALDPTRYGNAKGVSGAVSVAIQINIPPPPQRVTVERTVSATEEPEDADYCEA